MSPICESHHPIFVKRTASPNRGACRDFSRSRNCLAGIIPPLALTLAFALGLPILQLSAQAPSGQVSAVDPLPQDTGTLGLKQMVLRAQNTARLMQTTAHPDDEDGGMLTLESRGRGVTALLMSLTHGEGGQNKVGSNLFDALGVLRTLELTASDRYYGVEQRFSRAADFGYSKTPEETFEKWGGHDVALADLVRVIRTFRPDVLIARFSGTGRDGHGHHQASAMLTQEAFRAAADAARFPEQIKEDLLPWQAKKLYVGNVCGFGAMTCPAENYTVRLNTGSVNPALGMSYVQFALEGLRHQLSQGAGGWSVEPGDRFTHYKLIDSVLPSATDKDGHEKDFFDGIDTTLPGLASRLGEQAEKAAFLKPALEEVSGALKEASAAAGRDPGTAAPPLSRGLQLINRLLERIRGLQATGAAGHDLQERLTEKKEQIQIALGLALNVSLVATTASSQLPDGHSEQAVSLPAISPGQSFAVRVRFHNGGRSPVKVRDITVEGIPSRGLIEDKESGMVEPGHDYENTLRLDLPRHFPYTRPALHRDDPERDSVYAMDDPRFATWPFPPFPLRVTAGYEVPGEKADSGDSRARAPRISAPVLAPYFDERGTERRAPLAVVPAFSVMLEPAIQSVRTEGDGSCNVRVGVSYNLSGPVDGKLRLRLPPDWHSEPAAQAVSFQRRGERQEFQFKVFPASRKEGYAKIRALLSSGGAEFTEGYSLVTREDLGTFYYYQPAVQTVSIVDVKVPKDLKVAYIPGAGDDIPTVLQQLGIDLTSLPAERLADEDLSRYGTVVLGIRAYDTQKDVVANNKKLLNYVSAGGTLMVQYNASAGDFNDGHFTPFPAKLSRGRVSVEDAPVEILAADDRVFHYPNQITPRDFDGWVQERGLYFMDPWDASFKPLLSSHDPGEPPLKGGLLMARYGKGTYIYAGYAFFRQLPAGVAGAIRLYVNLLAAGH